MLGTCRASFVFPDQTSLSRAFMPDGLHGILGWRELTMQPCLLLCCIILWYKRQQLQHDVAGTSTMFMWLHLEKHAKLCGSNSGTLRCAPASAASHHLCLHWYWHWHCTCTRRAVSAMQFPTIHLPDCLLVCLSVCISNLFVCLAACWSVCLCICFTLS